MAVVLRRDQSSAIGDQTYFTSGSLSGGGLAPKDLESGMTGLFAAGVDWGLMVVVVLLVLAGLVLFKLWPLARTEMAAARPQAR